MPITQVNQNKYSKILRYFKGTMSLTLLLMHCIQPWPLITIMWVKNLKSNFLSYKYWVFLNIWTSKMCARTKLGLQIWEPEHNVDTNIWSQSFVLVPIFEVQILFRLPSFESQVLFRLPVFEREVASKYLGK